MALQAVKVEGKRKPEVPGVKSLSLRDSQRLLFAFNPVWFMPCGQERQKGKESAKGKDRKIKGQKEAWDNDERSWWSLIINKFFKRFQTLKCVDLLPFTVLYHCKWNTFWFWSVHRTKRTIWQCHLGPWKNCKDSCWFLFTFLLIDRQQNERLLTIKNSRTKCGWKISSEFQTETNPELTLNLCQRTHSSL